jgi:hypothetical protein
MRGGRFGASWLASLAGAAVAAGLAGCGEGGCPEVKRCDVRQRGCQDSVMRAMACLRGGGSDDLPAVRVIDEAEFIERVNAYMADDDVADEQAEREASYALWTRGLSLFGLAPADYEIDDLIADVTSQVAAAYFADQREILIIDRGAPLDDGRAIELFAHEIVHALQDQELDLRDYERRFKTSFDASLALDALIEGEAVHYQILAAVQLAGRSPHELNWPLLYSRWRHEALTEAEADDAPVALADVRFPYAFGGNFVSERWREHDRAGIDALFEDPPRTTSQVLFRRNPGEFVPEQAMLSEHAVPALDPPFVESASTALGAWIALMYATRADPEATTASDIAGALAADVFSVQHDAASDTLVAAWRARLFEDTPSTVAWPSPPGTAIVHETDESGRETYSVLADPQSTEQPEMLAWRAPEPDEDQGEQGTAAPRAPWRRPPGRGHYRACAANRPRLPFTGP